MSFQEISEVVPWLELAWDQGQNLEDKQYGEDEGKPRFFKTHAWEKHCPKFKKTIVVLRHPYDVLKSFYNFFEGWFFEAGTISLEEFAQEFWLARDVPTNRMQNASYFVHLTSWYERRDDPSVLFVFFEDMKDNLRKEVARIAEFVSNDRCGFSEDNIIDIATHKSSYAFMKENSNRFDEKLSKLARNEACGLPKDAGMTSGKLKDGQQGGGKLLLSDELKARVDEKWMKVVYPVTSCRSYEEFRQKLSDSWKDQP